MQWTDARVVIVDVLCTAEQQAQLVSQVAASLRAFEKRVVAKQGRWVTTGIRLREPRDDAERAWLVESLAQPDDPLAIERRPMVLEIGERVHRRAQRKPATPYGTPCARMTSIPVRAPSRGAPGP